MRILLAPFPLLLLVLAGCGGGGSAPSPFVGAWTLDVERTLGVAPEGAAAKSAAVDRARRSLNADTYRLTFTADREFRLTLAQGGEPFTMSGSWSPEGGGIVLTTVAMDGAPLDEGTVTVQRASLEGDWLVVEAAQPRDGLLTSQADVVRVWLRRI